MVRQGDLRRRLDCPNVNPAHARVRVCGRVLLFMEVEVKIVMVILAVILFIGQVYVMKTSGDAVQATITALTRECDSLKAARVRVIYVRFKALEEGATIWMPIDIDIDTTITLIDSTTAGGR